MWQRLAASQKARFAGSSSRRAQNLIEYAIVVAAVVSAMFAMSTYVFRSVQATQQAIQEEAAK